MTNCASVCVFVWSSLFSNVASTVLAIAAAWLGLESCRLYVPTADRCDVFS